jgi:hypothetical protein
MHLGIAALLLMFTLGGSPMPNYYLNIAKLRCVEGPPELKDKLLNMKQATSYVVKNFSYLKLDGGQYLTDTYIAHPVVDFQHILMLNADNMDALIEAKKCIDLILIGQEADARDGLLESLQRKMRANFCVRTMAIQLFCVGLSEIRQRTKNSTVDTFPLVRELIKMGASFMRFIPQTNDRHIRIKTDFLREILTDPEINAYVSSELACMGKDVDLKYLVDLGCSVNGRRKDSFDSSYLHHLVANENYTDANSQIKLLESLRGDGSNPNRCFDYAMQDKNGKTLLMLATQTRNLHILKTLMELHAKKRDIGINIQDSDGRTPLMIATALGMHSIVSALLSLGADPDLTDEREKSLQYYVKLPDKTRRLLIKEMIHPDRSINVNHSYLYSTDAFHSPWSLSTSASIEDEKTQHHHFLVLSPLTEHQVRLKRAFDLLNALQSEEMGDMARATLDSEIAHFREQWRDCTDTKTVWMAVLEGLAETKKIIDALPSSVLKQEPALGEPANTFTSIAAPAALAAPALLPAAANTASPGTSALTTHSMFAQLAESQSARAKPEQDGDSLSVVLGSFAESVG